MSPSWCVLLMPSRRGARSDDALRAIARCRTASRMAGAREWLTSSRHGSSVILPSRTTTPKCRRCLTASMTSRIMLRYSSTGATPATLSHTKKSWLGQEGTSGRMPDTDSQHRMLG
jgi:hypothetical protein